MFEVISKQIMLVWGREGKVGDNDFLAFLRRFVGSHLDSKKISEKDSQKGSVHCSDLAWIERLPYPSFASSNLA